MKSLNAVFILMLALVMLLIASITEPLWRNDPFAAKQIAEFNKTFRG